MSKTVKYFFIGAIVGLLAVGTIVLFDNKGKIANILSKKISKNRKMKILFVGDSFTEYVNSYAEQLKALNPNIEITKIAKIGATTNWIYPNMVAELSKNNYDVVMILAGYNDVYSGVALSQAQMNILRMINDAQYKKIKVVVSTISPSGNNPNYSASKQAYEDALNKYIMSSIADYKIDFYSLMQNPNKKGFPKEDVVALADGEHANSEGHKLLANEIYKTIFK